MKAHAHFWILFPVSALTAFCLSSCGERHAEKNDAEIREKVSRWETAVRSGDAEKALCLAGRLISGREIPRGPAELDRLFEYGLEDEHLSAEFDIYDFQLWEHAAGMKDISDAVAGDSKEECTVSALFTAVRERIDGVEPPPGEILWPRVIWELGKGVCDRQAWVLCELAYQAGYETQIVYFGWERIGHVIAEIRDNGRVWAADPYSGVLLEGVSIRRLSEDEELAMEIWPGRPEWRRGISEPEFHLPSYPQDYFGRNQALGSIVRRFSGGDSPRFGKPPAERMRKYSMMAGRGLSAFRHDFWRYPFALYKYQEMRERMGGGHGR